MDFLQRSKKLHQTAQNILNELNLLNFLNKFGQTVIVGSVAIELMSWEDIDIVVDGDQKIDDFLKTVDYLFKQPNIYSLNIQDFRRSIFENRP